MFAYQMAIVVAFRKSSMLAGYQSEATSCTLAVW